MLQELKYTLTTDDVRAMLAAHLKIESKAVHNIEVVRVLENKVYVFAGLAVTVGTR